MRRGIRRPCPQEHQLPRRHRRATPSSEIGSPTSLPLAGPPAPAASYLIFFQSTVLSIVLTIVLGELISIFNIANLMSFRIDIIIVEGIAEACAFIV